MLLPTILVSDYISTITEHVGTSLTITIVMGKEGERAKIVNDSLITTDNIENSNNYNRTITDSSPITDFFVILVNGCLPTDAIKITDCLQVELINYNYKEEIVDNFSTKDSIIYETTHYTLNGEEVTIFISDSLENIYDTSQLSCSYFNNFTDTVDLSDDVVKNYIYPLYFIVETSAQYNKNTGNISIASYLLNYKSNIYHPEMVDKGTLIIKNGRTPIKEIEFDRNYGTSDGNFKFTIANLRSYNNLFYNIKYEIEDCHKVIEGKGAIQTLIDNSNIPLTMSASPDNNDYRSSVRLEEFGETPAVTTRRRNIDFAVPILETPIWFYKFRIRDTLSTEDSITYILSTP
jgi:hypothetical protein